MKNKLKSFFWRLLTVIVLTLALTLIVISFVPVALWYLVLGEDLTKYIDKLSKVKSYFSSLS